MSPENGAGKSPPQFSCRSCRFSCFLNRRASFVSPFGCYRHLLCNLLRSVTSSLCAQADQPAFWSPIGGQGALSRRLARPDHLALLLDLDAEPRVHRPKDRKLLAADDIAGQLAPHGDLNVRDRHRAREPRRLRLPKLPEPLPNESAMVWHLHFRTFRLKTLVALAPGLTVLVSDTVIARDNRYGFAEPFAKLFVKFARSSEAAATWS